MDLSSLRTFVDVIRRGSFAAVARDRGLAASSVSRGIATLEAELGRRLFYRNTRQLAPTDQALSFFDIVAPLVDELEKAAQVAFSEGEAPRGTLRVNTAASFAQESIIPLTSAFPQVALDLVISDKLISVIDNRIDLAVHPGRLSDSTMIATRLFDVRHVCCASLGYLDKRGVPEAPLDLLHHDCIRYPSLGSAEWSLMGRDGNVCPVPVRGHVIAADGTIHKACAEAGMGIAALAKHVAARAVAAGKLVRVLPDYELTGSDFTAPVWLIYPYRTYVPPVVRCFADFLKRKLRDEDPCGEDE